MQKQNPENKPDSVFAILQAENMGKTAQNELFGNCKNALDKPYSVFV